MRLKNRNRKFLKGHSLSLATVVILLFWIVQYVRSDPNKHAGNFYGNAIADWTGVLVMVLATKYFYEVGSSESRKPRPDTLSPALHILRAHSLTIFLIITGVFWVTAYLHMSPTSRWGQVVGNIVSEWTQIIGLVIMTKRLVERGSKE
jgi:hypothetical protein